MSCLLSSLSSAVEMSEYTVSVCFTGNLPCIQLTWRNAFAGLSEETNA